MKNFTLKLCLIFTILSICATSFADVVFKFKTPSDWSKCHIWAWDDDNTQLASTTDWPGDAAMTLGSDGYYTYTLKTSVTKVNFLFNNGASSGTKQTVDASTTKTKFMGRYGSTNTQDHYNIIEETFVDTDDSGDDDVVTPDNPQPTGEVTIAAIRNRLSINTNDFTDFAGLYVSALPKAGDATVSYEWQYSTDNATWAKYSAGDGSTWDNIRPNKAGYYRCVLSYDLEGVVTTFTSNTLQITNKGGNSVTFSSNLPVILVRTAKDFPTAGLLDNDGVAALKAKRSVDVKILWNEEGGSVKNTDINNADMLHYDRKARMNYRGSSSLRNPKKSYAFVTGDKNCDSKKLGEVKTKKFGMFGAEAQKDWVLYASYPDATYMRNILTFHQYAQMTGLWGVKCRYVELYVDGSYQGIYVFMDKITQDENRVNVNEDTGFIVKFDKTDEVDS
ncbi:MAG: CotH kinase family protein, partial [Paludibacteraceae bacterium]|nr:CotH kinase family protein [Paludibacteraceae bacterium]